jgi:hypothetical protein
MNFTPHTYKHPKTYRLERLFFAHPDAIKIYKQHPDVVLLDCTYKTNRFRMPLFNICTVTGNRKTVQVALVFLSGEKDVDYEWAMKHFRDLQTNNDISEPLSWVTDRELAVMNILEKLFPGGNHLLCTWHVNMNVLANCRKLYPADTKDRIKVTLANPQGYVSNPKWMEFLTDWASLLDSATEEEYTSRLTKFRVHKDDAVKYVVNTWLKWKEKLVRYTYIPGTVPERLYKRALKAHESDDSDGAYVLTHDILAPTLEEIRAVEAEVGDKVLDRAIEAIKLTVRSSGRQRVDTPKVKENKELMKK